jgi:hypothetical protein
LAWLVVCLFRFRWLTGFRWLDFELADVDPGRAPTQAGEQRIRSDLQRATEADERVGPGGPFAALKLTDGGAVQLGEESEFFLADSQRLAMAEEVQAELPCEGLVAGLGAAHDGLQVSGIAAAELVVVQGCSRRDDDRTRAQGEPGPMQLHDRAIDAVAAREVTVAELKFALEVGRLEMSRPVDEESVEDEGLILQVFVRGLGAMRHRVLISHEELCLLVVRPSVGVASTAGGRLCFAGEA